MNGGADKRRMFLKVMACEIALRELCFAGARSPHLLDFEFLTQGHHDVPAAGRADLQQRINAVPAGKYDAILLGYGLCSNMLVGLRTAHTPVVIPRAHDCITFFLGSKARYQEHFAAHPGTYYYTAGWLECRRRRGLEDNAGIFLPANSATGVKATYEGWVKKYGEEQARYLMEVLGSWSEGYTHGMLIDFEFVKHLGLDQEVRAICAQRGWQFETTAGDLRLLEKMVNGEWDVGEFLILRPNEELAASYDEGIIGTRAAGQAV
jgi:hypothetical protein